MDEDSSLLGSKEGITGEESQLRTEPTYALTVAVMMATGLEIVEMLPIQHLFIND